MPSWWGKSSSKELKKKENKDSFLDSINWKFRTVSEEKGNNRSGASQRHSGDFISEKGSRSRVQSRSPSPSTKVSRCQSFVERPRAQPLPLPGSRLTSVVCTDSGINASKKPGLVEGSKTQIVLPPLRPGFVANRLDTVDAEGDIATASVFSDSSIDSEDPPDSRLLRPQVSDYENGNKTTMNSPSSVNHKDQSPVLTPRNPREALRPANLLLNNQIPSTSPKWVPLSTHVPNFQVSPNGAFCSAPDSSMSSPSRSPLRLFSPEQVINSAFWTGKPYVDIALLGSGHCSSPGSGHNSGHNSVGGDMSGHLFWPHSRCSPECSPIPSPRMTSPGPSSRIHSGAVTLRCSPECSPIPSPRMTSPGPSSRIHSGAVTLRCSPECSPIPSPRMTSPGPSSRIHSGAVTPLHPRAGVIAAESPTNQPDDGKQQSHRLPLPPITIPNSSAFSPTYSTSTTPSVPRSPGRAENPISPGSRWKKGRLLGRGTFGHVYLGFNSESGEMCAMKEVTLFSDDAKSKESAQQLGQEISLLSRLSHPNIVQYYGFETVDDKLYIYLEYVSGGSIYTLLNEYGQFGEIAIRSYTQQILSGLAYLHAKNTVHRDIKGANILVDPSGRVKLADFGMAKHITGQSCPLSFKGSPYWMAPEVIKNSNGCNLAVDIWSLGCTVLEMATTKPPWSQYEGVAAMFKIGNSKELPTIPGHLSDEGKDFVRQCLQRNPLHRPAASRLLEHPFVRNAVPLERPIISSEPEPPLAVTNAVRSMGIGHPRNVLESEGVAIHPSRGSKVGSGSSDSHTPRNISSPVSPIGNPLLHSRSPRHMSGRMSPSPISSPHTTSGSSTPLTGGSGAIPFHHPKPIINYMHEGIGIVPRSQNSLYANGSSSYQDPQPDIFRAMPQVSHVLQEIISSENGNGSSGNQFGRPVHGDPRDLYDPQSFLSDSVSQQLLRDSTNLNLSLDLNPGSPMLTRTIGI